MLMFGGFLYISVTMLKFYPNSGKPRTAASELEDSIIEYTPNTLVHAHTHTCLCTHSVHTHEHRYTHMCLCVHACEHRYTPEHGYTHMLLCVHTCEHRCTHMLLCVHACEHRCTHLHVHTQVCTPCALCKCPSWLPEVHGAAP